MHRIANVTRGGKHGQSFIATAVFGGRIIGIRIINNASAQPSCQRCCSNNSTGGTEESTTARDRRARRGRRGRCGKEVKSHAQKHKSEHMKLI